MKIELKLIADVGLVGLPNAGKSTLMNMLIGENRAITSHIPGTTRDTIHENLVIDDMFFKLVDTAGRIERFRKKYEKFQNQ